MCGCRSNSHDVDASSRFHIAVIIHSEFVITLPHSVRYRNIDLRIYGDGGTGMMDWVRKGEQRAMKGNMCDMHYFITNIPLIQSAGCQFFFFFLTLHHCAEAYDTSSFNTAGCIVVCRDMLAYSLISSTIFLVE